MKTEEKTKVVASVGGGGEKFIKFLAAIAVLPMTILKNRMNSSFSIILVQFILLFKIVL